MKKTKNLVINKEQYEHSLIAEIEILTKENDKLNRNLNILQKRYEEIVNVYTTEDCYTCVCGMVSQCNCKHMGYLKHKHIDIETLNTMWTAS